jgi:hypothetical protein
MTKKIASFGLLILICFSAYSLDKLPVKAPVQSAFEIYSAGKINQCPVYQLVIDNLNKTQYQIILRDQYGQVLYDEYISEKKAVRNYMIDVFDLGETDVFIEVYNQYGLVIKRQRLIK